MYDVTWKNHLRRRLRDLAGRGGFSIVRQNDAVAQRAALATFRPVRTEHELVRIGFEFDGGYLVPDDLEGIAACFSPGVGFGSAFEQGMLDRGIRTFQIDASVESSPLIDPRNDFEPKFLGVETVGNRITLDDWVAAKLPGTSDLLLQIDIEGHEWLALAQVGEETLKRFRIIVAEFHFLDRLFDDFGAVIVNPVMERLTRHFDIVHLHANNFAPLVRSRDNQVPPAVEVTFLRKDRSTTRHPVERLPHPLDTQTNPKFSPVYIPEAMYR